MNRLVNIAGVEIQIKEYREQRVVTFEDIDMAHGRAEGTSSRNFRQNRGRFIEGEDFYEIQGGALDEIRRNLGLSKYVPAITLITESGYLMLVKSLTDDLAWEVQRQLVNNYFRAKELVGGLNELSPQLQVLINMELRQKRMEQELSKAQSQIGTIKDTIVERSEDWRKDVVKKLRKIGFKHNKYDEFTKESYRLLEERAACNLEIRLENLRQRMALEGATRTAIKGTNYLDVIDADKRLKEIYINIVSQMYVKYAA